MDILKRLFKKLNIDNVCSFIDEASADNGQFYARGWIFNKQRAYTKTEICFDCGDEVKRFLLPQNERNDVYNAFNNENAKNSGFDFSAVYECDRPLSIYLECTHSRGKDRLAIASASPNGSGFYVGKTVAGYVDFSEFSKKYVLSDTPDIPENIYEHEFDVIIPVYNGFEFLEDLFKTVEKTKLKYRLILVNDASPDERVLPYLRDYAASRKNVVLIENHENLGFVQSVNKALKLSDKHVALVNSDVFLPELWLERLMLPIINDDSIASATPFTTCGTICSFPDFCKDNPIFLDKTVDQIDAVFSRFVSKLDTMPTGVGFCMGMNRNVINRVGLLNAEVFYKGYGEENDWCQRAIQLGCKNVHVENLFVYHKHGGSFLSEDKKRYIERNLKLLNQMHPNYDIDVQKYCKSDPAKPYREYAKLVMCAQTAEKNIIMFDHNWGGGANSYSKRRIEKEQQNGYGVLDVIKESGGLYAKYHYKGHTAGFSVKDTAGLDAITDLIGNFEQIIINELVSFDDVYPILEYITGLKARFGAKLIMLGHDFYSLCPSIYLIDKDGKHCFKCDNAACAACLDQNPDKFSESYGSIEKWRAAWGSFLAGCDEITVFSQNSKSYFLHRYPDLKNIVVLPHTVDYVEKVQPYPTHPDKIVVGILGNFMRTKGAQKVLEMHRRIKAENLPMQIVVIGQNLEQGVDDDLKVTGRYRPEDLPEILRQNKVDIIFIASIWPETFSYTTQEVINMGLPVASFDIGAPAERISKYEKGLIIPEMTADAAIKAISGYIRK